MTGQGIVREFRLKLRSGRIVEWNGVTGEDAARRYVASHPDEAVIATRPARPHGVFAGMLPIVEPGDKTP